MNQLVLYRSLTWQTQPEIRAELDARAEALRRLKALPLTPREITNEVVLTDAEKDELFRLKSCRHRNPGTPHEL